MSQNERIEDEFPHASPEGDPEDYGLYDKVVDEDEVEKNWFILYLPRRKVTNLKSKKLYYIILWYGWSYWR